MRNDNFKFHVPVKIIKGGKDSKTMKLAGIASTSDRDRQGEVLLPDGFDYTYLRDNGYINWHHQLSKNPEAVIGEPTKVQMRKGGLYIEGELYKDSEMAKKAYQLAHTLEKNSKSRRLGWSIEGKVVERDPNDESKVLKARITGVALTPMPINKNTLVSIMKAMGVGDDQTETVETEDTTNNSGNGGETYLLNESIGKDGYVRVDKAGEITINLGKGMTTTSARAVIPESVEGTPRDTQQNYNKDKKKLEENEMDVMNKSEAYEHIFLKYPDMTIGEVKRVVAKVIENKEKES